MSPVTSILDYGGQITINDPTLPLTNIKKSSRIESSGHDISIIKEITYE